MSKTEEAMVTSEEKVSRQRPWQRLATARGWRVGETARRQGHLAQRKPEVRRGGG